MTELEAALLNAYIKEVNGIINHFLKRAPEEHMKKIREAGDTYISAWNSCLLGKAPMDDFTSALSQWKELIVTKPIKMKRDRKLTEKQLKFIDAFVKYNNAAKAARLAGYSAGVSKQIGYTVLRKPPVTEAIYKALQEKQLTRLT